MKALKLAISPAALCFWALCLCVGYSIVSSNASRVVAFKQESRFGYAKTSFPLHMKRWDEALFALLAARAKSEMAEFLKNAEQEANAKPIEGEWKPYTEAVSYIEQFRTSSHVSYLEVATVKRGDAPPTVGFRTVNFDSNAGKELALSDIIEGAADRSKTLDALASYARADLKEETGEDEESDALLDLPPCAGWPIRGKRFPRHDPIHGLREIFEAENETALFRRASGDARLFAGFGILSRTRPRIPQKAIPECLVPVSGSQKLNDLNATPRITQSVSGAPSKGYLTAAGDLGL
jgi:hypothetical protein